ncbi:MAG: phosphatidate cytidylyltransferase [Bdellovibrio sp.]|nr:phosphatidate cytidylyltransferase [Bdellovibrio sp.]
MNEFTPELKKRVATGVLGGLFLLAVLIYGNWIAIFFLITLMSIAMLYEYTGIVLTMPDKVEKRYILLTLGWFVSILDMVVSQGDIPLLALVFVILFGYFLLTANRCFNGELIIHFRELALSLFGIVYLVLIPAYFYKIYQSANGREWSILFLLIVFTGDTAAYFAGKRFGKTKLYEAISPKKTVEGAVGGLLCGAFVALIFKGFFFKALSWSAAFEVSILVGVISQIGDLCESLFKRAFGTKDSGSVLPGHGGVLDRFDGVVFSLPVMYACVRLFGN